MKLLFGYRLVQRKNIFISLLKLSNCTLFQFLLRFQDERNDVAKQKIPNTHRFLFSTRDVCRKKHTSSLLKE